jgi:hypothetical protein
MTIAMNVEKEILIKILALILPCHSQLKMVNLEDTHATLNKSLIMRSAIQIE